MAPKADKLQQNIDSIKSFLFRKSGAYPELNQLMEDIKHLEKILSKKKLTLQIVGDNEILNQATFDFISANPEFTQAYNIKYDPIPQIKTPKKNELQTTLILERLIADSTEIIEKYPLETNETYVIGRSEENHISLDSQLYQGVSWEHLEIKPIQRKNQDEYEWEINDLNSSNGTFINGEQIKESHILKSDDHITIGNSELKAKIASFQFKQELIVPEEVSTNIYDEVIDCDLLLMVVTDKQKMNREDKSFLSNLDISFMSKQFLIVDISDEGDHQQQLIGSWEKS